MRLQDIMNADVQTIGIDMPAKAAWAKMSSKRIHHLVVLRQGMVVGVVSDRDLGGRHGNAFREGKVVGDLMTHYAVTAKPTTTVRQAANLLRGRSIGCLPVLNKGKLAGIITVSDLLELLGRGVEHPVTQTTRWTLRRRGPRQKAVSVP
ncbi:MAG: CBS domain-containing protein [Planctomycetota bacterium]